MQVITGIQRGLKFYVFGSWMAQELNEFRIFYFKIQGCWFYHITTEIRCHY